MDFLDPIAGALQKNPCSSNNRLNVFLPLPLGTQDSIIDHWFFQQDNTIISENDLKAR